MSAPGPTVDFDVVRENARRQGVSLDQIAIFYANLTSAEKSTMSEQNLITHDTGEGMVIARFRADGSVAFPEKATAIHYLAAD